MRIASLAIATLLFLLSPAALAQSTADPAGKVLSGKAAFGDWRGDAPLVRRKFTVDDLPTPYATKSADNAVDVVARPASAVLKVPAGFQVELVASDLDDPRTLAVAPNGDVFIAESRPGRIRI